MPAHAATKLVGVTGILQSHQTCVAQVTHSSLTPADINVKAFHTYVQLKLFKTLKKKLKNTKYIGNKIVKSLVYIVE